MASSTRIVVRISVGDERLARSLHLSLLPDTTEAPLLRMRQSVEGVSVVFAVECPRRALLSARSAVDDFLEKLGAALEALGASGASHRGEDRNSL